MPHDAEWFSATGNAATAIAWFYLVTNSARVVTYLPQILTVWRSTDGARSISLLTWGAWVISHSAAVLYGSLIVHDRFFVVISMINLVCCAAVTCITVQRRRDAAAVHSEVSAASSGIEGRLSIPGDELQDVIR